jgi:hypothetical protein
MSNALFWATNSRFFFLHGTAAELPSDASSITEMILLASMSCGSQHFGHNATCLLGELESSSATTFTRVPHLQRQNANNILAITAPSFWIGLGWGLYVCKKD